MINVKVYVDSGVVFEYEVKSPAQGREHAAKIIETGYRSTPEGSNDMTWWPPHRIDKVVVEGAWEASRYRDNPRVT